MLKNSRPDGVFVWWRRRKGCASVGYSPMMHCGISVITVGIVSPLLPLKSVQQGHFWTAGLNYGHFIWQELNTISIKTSCQQAWGHVNTGRGRDGKMKAVWCWVLGTAAACLVKQGKGKAGSQSISLPAWESRLGCRHRRPGEVWGTDLCHLLL